MDGRGRGIEERETEIGSKGKKEKKGMEGVVEKVIPVIDQGGENARK